MFQTTSAGKRVFIFSRHPPSFKMYQRGGAGACTGGTWYITFDPPHPLGTFRRGGGGKVDPFRKNTHFGFQNSNLVITRRPEGLRSSRFQLSAYFCTLFLVRWVPGLKSFNLIDFILLGLVSVCFGEVWGGFEGSKFKVSKGFGRGRECTSEGGEVQNV